MLIDTDVLIVGCGPAGLTAAVGLTLQGVRVCAVTKHARLAPTPRAHVTNQRTFEILRDFGVEAEAMALATPYEQMPNQVFLRSLVGAEFGRIRGMLLHDKANRDASPCIIADLPQHLLEPILFQAALKAGANIRFNTELVSFTQDAESVTAYLHDRSTGEPMTIRARYMIGADGGRSKVAEALNLPFEGPGKVGASLNILFECDLAQYVAHRPGMLYFFVRTAGDAGGAGLGILRCIKPWTSWLMIKGYAPGQETPHLSADEAADVIRDYLGVRDLEPQITGVDPWDMNSCCASVYHRDRVFCMGDAVHRHAPSNGLGSNTAIQDAYNLAWKLALVAKGKASPALLESYSAERVPVGQQVVARATRSMETYGPVLEAIGIFDPEAPTDASRITDKIAAEGLAGIQQRSALQAAVQEKVYEFQARGFELNQLYRSSAVVDEDQQPAETSPDLELFYRSTSCPGARLPHAWVQVDGHDVSTLDLVGKGRFTALTGIGGQGWVRAAEAAAHRFSIAIAATQIGPGCPVEDLYFEWADRREIAEDGCLLVRPDGHVAWRCHTVGNSNTEEALANALQSILSIDPTSGPGHRLERIARHMLESEAIMAERDEDDFVTVASYSEVGEAALAQSVLDGNGIDSFLSGEEANILLPVSGARLQVRLSDAETARELLNTVPNTELESGIVAGESTEGAALADNGDEL